MRSTVRAHIAFVAFAFAMQPMDAALAEGLPLDRFAPAPAGDRMFEVPSPSVNGHLATNAALIFDYAHNPLSFRARDTSANVVSDQLFVHANATLSLWNRLALNIDMPVALLQAGASPVVGGQAYASPDKEQVGDLRFGVRARVFGQQDSPVQLAIGGYMWLPTAPSEGYVGNGKVRGMPHLLLGGHSNRVVWSLLLGPKIQGTQVYAGVSQGTELDVGAGLGLLLLPDRSLQIGAEAYGAFTMVRAEGATNDSIKRAMNVEVLADVRYRVANTLEFGLGVGPGLAIGLGTPDFRGVVMAAYQFDPGKTTPGGSLAREVRRGADL